MLYTLLKYIIGTALKVYFKNIHVRNVELLPKDKPLIIVPNHPSAFMDPLIVASLIKPHLHFLAKGGSFKNPIARWIFGRLNMIPIFRPHESPKQMHKNKEVFQKAFNLLRENGSIIIFPEGISITERKLRKLKTGAARIALGAEADNNYNLDVKIIPVGINYSNPHRFQSEVFINFSKPIEVSEYLEEYRNDERAAVESLTEEIRARLEEHIIAIENEDLDSMVASIEIIYKQDLKEEVGIKKGEQDRDFQVTKDIIDAIHRINERDPIRVELVREKIEDYMNNLERLHLQDHVLKQGSKNQSIITDAIAVVFKFILGLPFFLFGVINNYLPFKIPEFFARMALPHFYGAIAMSTGIITFSLFYSLQIWAVINYVDLGYDPIISGIIYGILLPITGMFSIYYWRRLIRDREKWRFISLFYRKTGLISRLILQREEIIEELEKAKDEYLESIKIPN